MKTTKIISILVSLAALVAGSINDSDAYANGIAQEDPAVTNLRNYLRIKSAHPTPDYQGCIDWLKIQAEEIGLDFHLENFEEPGHFALWLTWNGTNPGLKSIMIDSHMDVVAVDSSKWDHDPFEAFKDENGNIFGRGALDMKSATVGVLEAIRRIKAAGFIPLRTIHITIMPDEEIWSQNGMRTFVTTPQFAELNVGFDLDEAFASQNDEMFITYAEKTIWQFNITAKGTSAHASTLPETTAGQKIQFVIDRLMEFRAKELEQLQNPDITVEDLTSVNLVRLGGGIGNNIIPDELWASFDMRILLKPGWNFTDVEAMLNNIALEAGSDVSISYIQQGLESGQTVADDSNIWWREIVAACEDLGLKCSPKIMIAATDGRFVRNLGIPVFGVNPFLNTPATEHQENERINENNFLDGIDRYAAFIRNLASVSANDHP